VFVDGAVTEIVEPDDDMSEEMEALKKENDELKEQIATAKAEKDAAKAEEDKINAAFDELFQDFKNFKSDVSSRFDVVVAKTKDEPTVELSPAQARLKKIKENKQR
jgi:chromosome segregation ATPase